jgi:hypothetical protein
MASTHAVFNLLIAFSTLTFVWVMVRLVWISTRVRCKAGRSEGVERGVGVARVEVLDKYEDAPPAYGTWVGGGSLYEGRSER